MDELEVSENERYDKNYDPNFELNESTIGNSPTNEVVFTKDQINTAV